MLFQILGGSITSRRQLIERLPVEALAILERDVPAPKALDDIRRRPNGTL